MREQTDAYEDQECKDESSDTHREQRTKPWGPSSGRRRTGLNAGNSRHFRLKTGVRGIVCHSIIQPFVALDGQEGTLKQAAMFANLLIVRAVNRQEQPEFQS
jgi:hypothetical protein